MAMAAASASLSSSAALERHSVERTALRRNAPAVRCVRASLLARGGRRRMGVSCTLQQQQQSAETINGATSAKNTRTPRILSSGDVLGFFRFMIFWVVHQSWRSRWVFEDLGILIAGESALILIRHGESLWNSKNLFTGCVDVPLSQKGVDEAIEAGTRISELPVDMIFTSALIRAQMTAMLAMTQHHRQKVSASPPSAPIPSQPLP
jgi:hypothetical protein